MSPPSLEWGKSLKTFTFFLHTYRAECAFPESSQSYKASRGTFEVTVLEKRSRNGTKARQGAAWEDTEDRPPAPSPPLHTDEEERGLLVLALMGSLRVQLLEGVSLLSSRNETWPVAAMEKPCISKPLTSPVLKFCLAWRTLICFPSPCGDWNIYPTHLSHKPTHTHTHSRIVGYPS